MTVNLLLARVSVVVCVIVIFQIIQEEECCQSKNFLGEMYGRRQGHRDGEREIKRNERERERDKDGHVDRYRDREAWRKTALEKTGWMSKIEKGRMGVCLNHPQNGGLRN